MMDMNTYQRRKAYMEEQRAKEVKTPEEQKQEEPKQVDALAELFEGMTRDEAEQVLQEYQELVSPDGLKKFIAGKREAKQEAPEELTLDGYYAERQKLHRPEQHIALRAKYRAAGFNV